MANTNPKTKDKLIVTVDMTLIEKLEKYSAETLVPKSAVVNKLLKEFFENRQ